MDVQALLSEAQRTKEAAEFAPVMDQINKEYPAIGKYNFHVRRGEGEGHLEFFPPWESENPAPGLPTIEVRNPDLKGKWLKSAIAGDALHYLGAINPQSGKPIDPTFRGLKQQFFGSITPQQLALDQRVYKEEELQNENPRSFGDWFDQSRGDAYIRGFLFPDQNDEWRQQVGYSPQQLAILGQMQQYLGGQQ